MERQTRHNTGGETMAGFVGGELFVRCTRHTFYVILYNRVRGRGSRMHERAGEGTEGTEQWEGERAPRTKLLK